MMSPQDATAKGLEHEPLGLRMEAALGRTRAMIDSSLAAAGSPAQEMIDRLLPLGGKMLRPRLVLLTGWACGGDEEELVELAAVVEMIHQATMIHDDLIDGAQLRHGRPAAAHWAGEAAVMLGDLLIAHAFARCARLGRVQYSQALGAVAAELCRGELDQVCRRGCWDMEESQYLAIAERKTGSLLGACCWLGAMTGGDGGVARAMQYFGRQVGLAYQLADDLLDVCGGDRGKDTGRDLALGDITLAVIHFRRACPGELDALLTHARQGRHADVAALLDRAGSLAYTAERARSLCRRAVRTLETLDRGEARRELARMCGAICAAVRRNAVQ